MDMTDYFKKFGLGVKTGVDIGDSVGLLVEPESDGLGGNTLQIANIVDFISDNRHIRIIREISRAVYNGPVTNNDVRLSLVRKHKKTSFKKAMCPLEKLYVHLRPILTLKVCAKRPPARSWRWSSRPSS